MKMRSKKQKAKMRKTKRYKGGMFGQGEAVPEPSKNSTNAQPSANGQVVPASPAEGQSPKETVMRHLNEALELLKQM